MGDGFVVILYDHVNTNMQFYPNDEICERSHCPPKNKARPAGWCRQELVALPPVLAMQALPFRLLMARRC